MSEKRVIIIRETMIEGIVNDVSMVSTFLILIGVGVWLDSDAMQWVGAFLAACLITSRAIGAGKAMTIDEAWKALDAIEQAEHERKFGKGGRP